ncbi:MAG: arginyl aminopeptidase [Fluviicola sp.]|nr:MAG: arginyl aminopeptidase [Fluviicola sp.]
MRYLILLFLLISCSYCWSQTYAEQYAYYINKEELSKHIHVLASDSLEGRATGYPGQLKTSDYLIEQFKESGLNGPKGFEDMRFPYKVVEITPSGEILLTGKPFQYYKDFLFFGTTSTLQVEDKEVIYISKTVSENETVDVKNKIVLLRAEREEFDYEAILKNTSKYVEGGASAIIYLTPFFKNLQMYFKDYAFHKSMRLLNKGKNTTPLLIADSSLINTVGLKGGWKRRVDKGKDIKRPIVLPKASFTINMDTAHLNTQNVVAFIEGGELKEEVLVLTAHMDHLGVEEGEVFNGADDNATGTAALLEIAKAFQLAKNDGHTLKRSLLIMPVSGEEKGLLGSQYYSENPIFPLENTVADLNIDMIGRIDKLHDQPNYVYIIGSDMISPDLHYVNKTANDNYVGLELDYTYNTVDDPNRYYYRSDHYNFAKHGVPSIFYFSGVHEDYHKSTDTVDKINFEKVETITKLVFFTAWELLDMEKGLRIDN